MHRQDRLVDDRQERLDVEHLVRRLGENLRTRPVELLGGDAAQLVHSRAGEADPPQQVVRNLGGDLAVTNIARSAASLTFATGRLGERKSLVFQGSIVRGLYYIAADIFAAVMRGGACGGSSQPSWASSSC